MSDTTIAEYIPRQIIADDLDVSFEDAIAGTLVSVEDGQIVEGTVVKVDKDEVLLDITPLPKRERAKGSEPAEPEEEVATDTD